MTDPTAAWPPPRPPDCNAALVLADGTVFWGRGVGATGRAVGEVCFNTSITGYQEILTDPSYAGADHHLHLSAYRQCRRQLRGHRSDHPGGARPRDPHPDHRAGQLPRRRSRSTPGSSRTRIVGLCGVDTRRLTRLIRDRGRRTASSPTIPDGRLDLAAMRDEALAWPGLEGMDLAQGGHLPAELRVAPRRRGGASAAMARRKRRASTSSRSITAPSTTSCACSPSTAAGSRSSRRPPRPRRSCATSPTASFCRTGPGDPAATAEYAVPVLRELIDIGQADVRHLPRPSAAGAGARRHDAQDGQKAIAAPTTRCATA